MDLDTRSRPRFLTVEQVAEEFKTLVRQLSGHCYKTGELRGFQIGRRGLSPPMTA